MGQQQLYTPDEAADLLHVPARVIRQWGRAGRAMPGGLIRAQVPGGLQALYTLAELEPLADRWKALQQRRKTGRRRRDGGRDTP